MPDVPPDYEYTDIEGDSKQITATVGTNEVLYPSSPGDFFITEFIVWNDIDNDDSDRILVRIPPETAFKTLTCGSSWAWTPKGKIAQIGIKANTSGVKFELTLNRHC